MIVGCTNSFKKSIIGLCHRVDTSPTSLKTRYWANHWSSGNWRFENEAYLHNETKNFAILGPFEVSKWNE